jgi:hypothetical protein
LERRPIVEDGMVFNGCDLEKGLMDIVGMSKAEYVDLDVEARGMYVS